MSEYTYPANIPHPCPTMIAPRAHLVILSMEEFGSKAKKKTLGGDTNRGYIEN